MSPRRRLARWMARYALAHRHPLNRASHLVGVPLIVYAALAWAGRWSLGGGVDGAMLVVVTVGGLYMRIEPVAGLATLAWTAALAAFAPVYGGALPAFVVGWAFQLAGHAVEGRRPALVENVAQTLVAPLFVTVEVLQHLGAYRDVGAYVDELVRDLDA